MATRIHKSYAPAYLWAKSISAIPPTITEPRLTRLDLETPGLSSSSGSLELPALAGNVWLSTLEGTTKVLDGLPNVPLSSEEDSVGSSRSSESEGVESNALSAGGGDSLSGRVGESESGDRELGNFGESLVVEDGTDSDNGLVTGRVGVLGLLDNSGDREGGSVDLHVSKGSVASSRPSLPCS
jgi:hypothetical protein